MLGLARGFCALGRRSVTNPEMLYIAIGILGATVMPHNLYLHSSIVQTRHSSARRREARGDPLRNDRYRRGADVCAVCECGHPDRFRGGVSYAAVTAESRKSRMPTSF